MREGGGFLDPLPARESTKCLRGPNINWVSTPVGPSRAPIQPRPLRAHSAPRQSTTIPGPAGTSPLYPLVANYDQGGHRGGIFAGGVVPKGGILTWPPTAAADWGRCGMPTPKLEVRGNLRLKKKCTRPLKLASDCPLSCLETNMRAIALDSA